MTHFIESLFEKVKPNFVEGGSLQWAWPLFEGAETFFLTPGGKTEQGAHVRDPMDMKRLMIFVLYALGPAILLGWYNVGLQAYAAEGVAASPVEMILRGLVISLPIIITSYTAGGIAELVFCIVRKHEINEGFLVTAMLFPLTLPPTIPLWMVAVGIIFGVVIGKEVFGGVGMNVLNPALTARAFVFFTYPAYISGAKVWDAAAGKASLIDPFAAPAGTLVDGYTGATPLLAAASGTLADGTPSNDAVAILDSFGFTLDKMAIGFIPGSIGEVSAIAALVGALLLITWGIASWRIMLGCVVGALVTAAAMNGIGSAEVSMFSLPPHYHLVMGGFAFGTVFMATDPCSSAVTKTGRLIYGFGIGVLVILVRVVNPAYPEGMMLAILFMNVFAPLIDYFIVRRTTTRRAERLAAA